MWRSHVLSYMEPIWRTSQLPREEELLEEEKLGVISGFNWSVGFSRMYLSFFEKSGWLF